MKIKHLAIAAACTVALMATSCNSDSDDGRSSIYTNIVTVGSATPTGTTFTFRQEGDSRLITYSSSQVISGDQIKPGNRVAMSYQMLSYDENDKLGGQPPFCNGTISILAAIPAIGLGDAIPVATAEETQNFKSAEVTVNSVWRSGEFLNVIFLKYGNGKYKSCRLVADKATLDDEYPVVHLIFENENDVSIEQENYAYYMSYSLTSIAGKDTAKGIILEFNDPQNDKVQIERGTLGGIVDNKPKPQQ